MERRVVPIGADRIEHGEVEVISLAQGAADHRLLLRQRRGRRFPGQELTERGGGDAESCRFDEEITPGQTPRAVSREELMNGDAGIHSNASLRYGPASRDWLFMPERTSVRVDHIKLRPAAACA